MDFSAQRTERTAAVPLDGGFAVGVVLRSGTGDGLFFEPVQLHLQLSNLLAQLRL